MMVRVGRKAKIGVFPMLSHKLVGQHQHQSMDMNVVPQQISHEVRNYAILSVVDNYSCCGVWDGPAKIVDFRMLSHGIRHTSYVIVSGA